MKRVIRIEHPGDNCGIWRSNGKKGCRKRLHLKFSFIDDLGKKHNRFPTPAEDFIVGFNRDYFCSFKSLPQMKKWIKMEWLDEMIKFGFRVYMIDVSEYIEGRYQICFMKKHIVKKEDITSIFQ